MSGCVTLYDVRVVDGYLLRLDVLKYINDSVHVLLGYRDLIKDFDYDRFDYYLLVEFKKLFYSRLLFFRNNLFMLHDVNLLSANVYCRFCEYLDSMEREVM